MLNTLSDVLGAMDARANDVGKSYRDFGGDVQLLFGALRGGDIFAYTALDEFPYEFFQPGWAVAGARIVQAIKNGAYFVYFYPAKPLLALTKTWRLYEMPEPTAFTDALNDFKMRIAKAPNGPTRDQIERYVVAIECQANPFMVPGHKYVLFQPKLPSSARGLARFPIGTPEKDMFLHLPLTAKVTRQLSGVVLETLRVNRSDIISLFENE